jgi:hypothetical protein
MSEPISGIRDYAKPGVFHLNITPNPFGSFVELSFESERPREMEFILRDILGRTVKHRTIQAHTGKNILQMEIPDIPAGPYVALLKAPDKADVQKLIRVSDPR